MWSPSTFPRVVAITPLRGVDELHGERDEPDRRWEVVSGERAFHAPSSHSATTRSNASWTSSQYASRLVFTKITRSWVKSGPVNASGTVVCSGDAAAAGTSVTTSRR